VINRQRDSLELLQECIEAIPNTKIHAVKNGYFATAPSRAPCEGVNLDDADGWIRLVNICGENPKKSSL
jgi:hypothetical protein